LNSRGSGATLKPVFPLSGGGGTTATSTHEEVDVPEDNKKFAEKYSLDFPIRSDPEKSVAQAYGVVHAKRAVAERLTFYIDKDGIIKEIDRGVQTRTQTAGEDIAAKVKELGLAGE
jgi:thioredoxin-dependent peroxiredoxin